MKIKKEIVGKRLNVSVEGALDTVTSPDFETEIAASLDNITELYIDLRNVEYVSSAGIRAFLYLYQIMSKKGEMVIHDVPEIVQEVFKLTSFTKVVTVE